MQTKISVTILAKNAQATLRQCLEKLQDFDEVILLDNQSTDSTLQIAKEFANVKIYQSEFIGFGALKNLALSYAKNEWILSLDSDEVLEKGLLEEIKTMQFQKGHYYSFLRKNLYRGEWIKGCGWHPDWVKRIFNKTEICFDDALVHEGLKIPKGSAEVRLKRGGIWHYTTNDIQTICNKMNCYTTMMAEEAYIKGKRGSFWGGVGRFVFVFVKDYFFRFGWRFGYRGFIVAWFNANGSMLKYLKLYEKQQDEN